eukprot:scaffold42563_cov57-Phaeocystis_antarctica.AAC.2
MQWWEIDLTKAACTPVIPLTRYSSPLPVIGHAACVGPTAGGHRSRCLAASDAQSQTGRSPRAISCSGRAPNERWLLRPAVRRQTARNMRVGTGRKPRAQQPTRDPRETLLAVGLQGAGRPATATEAAAGRPAAGGGPAGGVPSDTVAA